MGMEKVKADILYETGYFCAEHDCAWSIRHGLGLAGNSHCFGRVIPCDEAQADGRALSGARWGRGAGGLRWHFKSSVLD